MIALGMRTQCQLKPKELAEIEKAIGQDKRAEVKQQQLGKIVRRVWSLLSICWLNVIQLDVLFWL